MGHSIKTVILAGGFGTRLSEETAVRPKPMVEVGGRPILWHIMQQYAGYGFTEFVLALGYKAEIVRQYFADYHGLMRDLTVRTRDGGITAHGPECEDWTVHLIDTGLQTQTGGRVRRLREWIGDETFFLTYGDGVSNIPIDALLRFHRMHGKKATVSAVRPPARFGAVRLDGDRVAAFAEKPHTGEGWINGGFFVCEPSVLDYIESDESAWETGPLEKLAAEGELMAYRHEGFWQCMDTLRDLRQLETLWHAGEAPWLHR
jgi:glucose-1-phosphate cytidylyltransferase